MKDILIRKNGHVGHITLNRPKALNALTYDMILEIEKALISWKENTKISANNQCLKIQEEINSFFNQFYFSRNFKIKEIITFENALKNNFKQYKNFF